MTLAMGAANISFQREIPSLLAEVDMLCREIRSLLLDNGLGEVSFPVELAARECLNNAVIHGNRSDASKKVALNLQFRRNCIFLQVSDEGSGFNWRKVKRAPPPGDAGIGGRGLSIVALYAHRITFNRRGNQVTIWLKRC
jgi:serine/threonine-protein kinase RsbW